MFSFTVSNEIQIELLQQHHKDELFHLIDSNRAHLRKYLLWVDKRQSPKDLIPIFPVWLKNYAENNGFDAGIRYNGELIGMIGLHYIDWQNKSTSIGYFLSESAQGKGIITRCVASLLDYIFTVLDLYRVEIKCAESNLRSQAIPERLGFTLEGTIRGSQFLYDHYEDIAVYSMLAPEWNRIR
ncbi:GNAT family N-acetyltransferase [Peribacillus sp. SCS-26]|uniref:GNAT family N-acetyltransferase n=1 Tax=Paraperibacillus marinus TaxID=3115295 RepID=UPI003906A534